LKDILLNIKIDYKNIDIKNIINGKILTGNGIYIIYIFNDNDNKYLLKFENSNNLIYEKFNNQISPKAPSVRAGYN
jgi:hypothetical protein